MLFGNKVASTRKGEVIEEKKGVVQVPCSASPSLTSRQFSGHHDAGEDASFPCGGKGRSGRERKECAEGALLK